MKIYINQSYNFYFFGSFLPFCSTFSLFFFLFYFFPPTFLCLVSLFIAACHSFVCCGLRRFKTMIKYEMRYSCCALGSSVKKETSTFLLLFVYCVMQICFESSKHISVRNENLCKWILLVSAINTNNNKKKFLLNIENTS